jgi:hypothetical protein
VHHNDGLAGGQYIAGGPIHRRLAGNDSCPAYTGGIKSRDIIHTGGLCKLARRGGTQGEHTQGTRVRNGRVCVTRYTCASEGVRHLGLSISYTCWLRAVPGHHLLSVVYGQIGTLASSAVASPTTQAHLRGNNRCLSLPLLTSCTMLPPSM